MKKYLVIGLMILFIFGIYVSASEPKKEDIKGLETDSSFFLDSPLFTKEEENRVYQQTQVDFEKDGFVETLSNNNLSLYLSNKAYAIRVLDKRNGYVWASDVIGIENYGFNNAQRKRAQSAFEVYYRDEEGKIGKSITYDNDVQVNVSKQSSMLTFDVDMTNVQIKFQYQIELKNDKISVSLINESVEEYGLCQITSITFFPFFGAVYKNEIPGYALIPSGNGGLIRFDEYSAISSLYTASFYGSDANRVNGVEQEVLSLPIFGLAHGVGQNAMLFEIKKGDAFAQLNYSPSSIAQNFHMMYTTFNLRETYMLNITGSSSILMIPKEIYTSDISFDMSFLVQDEADYIGMAKAYQKSLIENNQMSKEVSNFSKVPVHLDVLGREYEQGLLFKKYYNMTTTEDLKKIAKKLEEQGLTENIYTLRGFNKGGYSNQSASNYGFESKLGRMKDLDDLDAYFYYNPVDMYVSKNKAPSNSLVNVFNDRSVVEVEAKEKYKFFTDVKTILSQTKKAMNKYEKIAIDGLGYNLYGDHNADLSRDEVQKAYQGLLDKKMPLFQPNSYLLSNTSAYLNLSLYHDRLRFITDSVPFIQIVLRGYIPYYSPYLNFSSNIELDVLKCIEFGSYPAYLISQEPSHLLSNTMSKNLYATHFDRIESTITSQYDQINQALNSVLGVGIKKRTILSEGIVEVVYENNVKIYINYSSATYTYQTLEIPSMGYRVVK